MDLKLGDQVVPVSDTFKQLSRDEQEEVIERIIAEKGIKPADPETTPADLVQGGKAAVTTGAAAIPLSIPALAYDLAVAPGHLLYKGIDYLAPSLGPALGYEKGFAKRHAELGGGPMGMSARNAELAAQASDLIVDPPKSSGGKIVRAVGSAGIEALGGSGIFRVAGKLFTSLPEAQAFLASMAEGPKAQAAYSAAAGGGGEIAEQQGAPPIVGALLGLGAAAGAHAAVPAVKAAPGAIKRGAENLFLPESVHERVAAERLAKVSKDPEALDAWTRSGETGELVEGSKPTLYEATDIQGVGHAQRDAFFKNTGEFAAGIEERRGTQNTARVEELRRLAGTGTPQEILTEFKRLRDDIDTTTATAERQAREGATETAQRAGTLETPEAIGEGIRGPVATAQTAAKDVGNELYAKIGAEGVTVGTGRLKAAIGEAFKDFRENPLAAREREIADIVRGYGGRVDFELLRELRKDVASRARNQNLPDAEIGRAKFLKKAIDRAMDDGLAKSLDADPDLFRRAVDGLEADTLPPKEGGAAPIDQGATERYRTAQRHWAENVKQPYEAAPVGAIVAEAPTPSGFKMTEGGVAGGAFVPGNKGAEAVRALKRAGATDDALAEAAALSFADPKRGVMRDGVVDPKGFRRWLNNYGPALDELPPEIRQRFQSANDAAETLRTVTEARKAELHKFDQSAVGKVAGIPVENLKGSISAYLENPSATNQLARQVANNADAKAGLQRLVADHILERFTNGADELSKSSLSTYVKRHETQLTAIFGKDGLDRFQRVAADIERSRARDVIGKDPAGPSTAADILRATAETSIMTVAASLFGPLGVAATGTTRLLHRMLRQSGINNVEQLYARALLDPEFARKILTKAPALKNEKFLKGLGSTILRSSVAGMAYGGNQ